MANFVEETPRAIFMHSTDIAPEETTKPEAPEHVRQVVDMLTEKVLERMDAKRAFRKPVRYRVVLRIEELPG